MKKPCYIFDIDGTLADTSHRQHFVLKRPKRFKEFFAAMAEDQPNLPIITLAQHLAQHAALVLCSGRPADHRQETVKWLQKYNISFDKLYMRSKKDFRPDTVIKAELLEQILADGYQPICIFDDRQGVVDMWREKGLTCCQVAPGDF